MITRTTAARWLWRPASELENAGLMAPSHNLREQINEIIRKRLIHDGAVAGPTMEVERRQLRGRGCGRVPPRLQAAQSREG